MAFPLWKRSRVENGRTLNVDMGGELADVYIGGKQYTLAGNQLTEG